MTSKPVLYSYFRSSASWRVRIALAYKGVEYDYHGVHLVKDGGQQNSGDYKALNPMSQVPTLKIDGMTLTQSLPIIEYLEETRPGNPLLPKEPTKRVQCRRVAELINSGIQPVQNLAVLQKVAEVTGDDSWKAKWGHFYIDKGFQALELLLQETSGKYCVGDEISLADLCLVPQHYNANRFKVDMSKYPIIDRIVKEVSKEPAFVQADPKNQPDCPEDLK